MMEMESQSVDKILEKFGEKKLNEVMLKIYSAEEISELNFNENDKDMILPLSQLGIINVENRYFYERPDKDKTRYNLFSISYKGKAVIDSILRKLNPPKRVEVFASKYPSKFLAFITHFLIILDNRYSDYEEKEYSKLFQKVEFANLLKDFKIDLEKFTCGFWIKEHTSKKLVPETPTLVLVPEFLDSLKNQLPIEIVKKELDEFHLAIYVERFFLQPPSKREWFEEFLRIVDRDELREMWKSWSAELTPKNILAGFVVLDPNGLRGFLAKKIGDIQSLITARTSEEENIKQFLKALEERGIHPDGNDRIDIASPCRRRKDFSILISAIYKILHDHMHIKDETVIDPIRCYLHHSKQDKQQEWYEEKFKEFCINVLLKFPPENDDDWRILKEKIIERAINKL
jgi:hypothetical protein